MTARRVLIFAAALYPCWLGMMAVHEAGHVLHAWASGGVVAAVRVPPAGFSITELSSNPRPRFVAWGGPVWGSILPLAAWAVWRAARWRGVRGAQFFAGFCLVANGAYLGVGAFTRAGDAGDLLKRGTPASVLVVVGGVAVSAGLYLWHRLGGKPVFVLPAGESRAAFGPLFPPGGEG
jgi:hypothetical protein